MDDITKIGKSTVHHGKENNRAYLMKLEKEDFPQVIDALAQFATARRYSKIFVKVPPWAMAEFLKNGYRIEAEVPGFYQGEEEAYFLARYLDPERAVRKHATKIAQIITEAQDLAAAAAAAPPRLPEGFRFGILTAEDAPQMAAIYKRVFLSYPFPVFSPDYLAQTMAQNVVYFGVRHGDALVALSSCEMDVQLRNTEMTDFATLRAYRGKGLASFLLMQMHLEMQRRGILTAYTIARSLSYGMNITFARQGYRFGGTLTNNTEISGAIESMNVWYRSLAGDAAPLDE